MSSEENVDFFARLSEFTTRFERDNVRSLLNGWDPRIVLIEDQGQMGTAEDQIKLAININHGSLSGIEPADKLNDSDVIVRGKKSALLGLLDGSLNPAVALLDESIRIEAQPEDQLKLDALSYALWD